MTATAAELRAEAAAHDTAVAESWERSDTDGFLSQWASGLTAAEKRMKADLLDAGGVSTFPGLFTADGTRVKAKLIDTAYGTSWALMDADGKFTGTFVGAFKKGPRSKLAKMGLHEAPEMAPAYVDYRGNTAVNVRPVYLRKDGGCPEEAVVL
jgi:hypothetical protein